jgi:hypothetical protein
MIITKFRLNTLIDLLGEECEILYTLANRAQYSRSPRILKVWLSTQPQFAYNKRFKRVINKIFPNNGPDLIFNSMKSSTSHYINRLSHINSQIEANSVSGSKLKYKKKKRNLSRHLVYLPSNERYLAIDKFLMSAF